MDKNLLISSLKNKNISFTDEDISLLMDVMKNTIKTNESFNLTSITNEDEFIEKMIFDSLLGLPYINQRKRKKDY